MGDLLVASIFASPLFPTNRAAGMPPCSNGNHHKSAEDSTFTGSDQIQGNLTAYDVGNQFLTTNPDSNNGDANGRRRCDSLFGSSASTEDVEDSEVVGILSLELQDKVVRNWLFGVGSEFAGTNDELRGSQGPEDSLSACDNTTEPDPETDFLFDAMKDESEDLTPPYYASDAQTSAHLQPTQDLSACQGELDVSSGATTTDQQDSNSLYVFGDMPFDPQVSTYKNPRSASRGNTSTQLPPTTENQSGNKDVYIAPSDLYQDPQSTSHHAPTTNGQFAIERGPWEFPQPLLRESQPVRFPVPNTMGEVTSGSFMHAPNLEVGLPIPQSTAQVPAPVFGQQHKSSFHHTMSSQGLDRESSCGRPPFKTQQPSLPFQEASNLASQNFNSFSHPMPYAAEPSNGLDSYNQLNGTYQTSQSRTESGLAFGYQTTDGLVSSHGPAINSAFDPRYAPAAGQLSNNFYPQTFQAPAAPAGQFTFEYPVQQQWPTNLAGPSSLRPFDPSFDWSQARETDTPIFAAQSNAAGPVGQSGSGKSKSKAQHPKQQPSASVQYRCEWRENPCNMLIDSDSRQDVLYHLGQYHNVTGFAPVAQSSEVRTSTDARKGLKVSCMWNDCKTVLKFENFYKHLASKHLATLARMCEDCGKGLSRPDSLKRHQEKSKDGICPVQGKTKGKKVSQVDMGGFDGEGLSDERPQKRQRV